MCSLTNQSQKRSKIRLLTGPVLVPQSRGELFLVFGSFWGLLASLPRVTKLQFLLPLCRACMAFSSMSVSLVIGLKYHLDNLE